jgi:hypothetical protein
MAYILPHELIYSQYLIFFNPRYERAIAMHAPNPVPPEVRLEIAIIAAPFFAISFFWFAWTSFPSISFVAPMMSGILLGWSILWIFVSNTVLLER